MKLSQVYSVCIMALSMVSTAAVAEANVARASFTSAIQDREPTDQVQSYTNDNSKIYFFTELSGLQDQTIQHRWEWNGQTMAEVSFNVGGERWRVWSSKNLQKEWLGTWKVSVIDSTGSVISTQEFNYEKAGSSSVASTTQDTTTQ